MIARPVLTIAILSIIPIAIIVYEQRKVHRINKIFNFRKELKGVEKYEKEKKR